jgi:hypothetical protein
MRVGNGRGRGPPVLGTQPPLSHSFSRANDVKLVSICNRQCMAGIPALQALAAAHVAAGPRLDHQPGRPTVPAGRPEGAAALMYPALE